MPGAAAARIRPLFTEKFVFRSFEMTFPGACTDFVQRTYDRSNLIVEYGSGGSTCYAAEAGKSVITVESSIHWLMELVSSCAERGFPGKVVPIWADIGQTKEWGHPVDRSKSADWHRYPNSPWTYCDEHDLSPDVVLIDGRFRVACFLATCLAIKKKTEVLFDDFAGRPYYHDVLDVVPMARQVGNRMAVFEVEPGQLPTEYLSRNQKFFLDPR